MYNPNKDKPTLLTFLTDRGIGRPIQADPRTARATNRNDALRAKGEEVARWREFIPTTEPAESLQRLREVRLAAGLSLGDLSAIVGQHPSLVQAAEEGRATIADEPLKAFLGAATAALEAHGDNA